MVTEVCGVFVLRVNHTNLVEEHPKCTEFFGLGSSSPLLLGWNTETSDV